MVTDAGVETTPVMPAPQAAPARDRYARLRAVLKQLGIAIVTLFIISIITFGAIDINGPSAVARAALGRGATPEQIQAYVKNRNLDAPVVERYTSWLGDFVRGDWGVSPVTNRPVRDDVVPRFEKTLLLSLVAIAIALPI